MIVVGFLGPESGTVAEIARRAAATGSRVEVLGVVPGDATWDGQLFELAQGGVGHATVVRAGRSTLEPADLDLSLRYLPDIRCIVLLQPPARLIPTAVAGADFAGSPLVLIGPLHDEALAAIESRTDVARSAQPIVLDPPAQDPDGTFAGFVARLATRLDAGEAPEAAFRATVSALGVDPA